MTDIIDKIEEKFGDAGVVFAMILAAICAVVIIVLWLVLTNHIPAIGMSVPFLVLGWMVWFAHNDRTDT
jgi:hypothetical protein